MYSGTGETAKARGVTLPVAQDIRSLDRPQDYLAEPGLRDAVNVALNLSVPLLLTGEPGTGKTQLAYSLAYELGLPPPRVFNTKTTSTARDLFYRYDALQHFRDASLQRAGGNGAPPDAAGQRLPVDRYLEYEALGLAILEANEPARRPATVRERLGDRPSRSVVLVDEVDKAPRDLPNDVLNEIEAMSFTVKETGETFSAKPEYRPILVLTSNSEKNLPEAFLRRCVFYNLSFPDEAQLTKIVERRLGENGRLPDDVVPLIKHAIAQFRLMREEVPWSKRPATAELLAWLRILRDHRIDMAAELTPAQRDLVHLTLSAIAKTPEDLEALRKRFSKK